MNQFDRNKTGFSYTEKLNEYTRNPEWSAGYDIVRDGKLKTIPGTSGKIDFNGNENFSTLWYTLSSAFEGVGNTTYTYIADLLQSARDIDVCTIHALKSIAEELDVTDIQVFDLPYPVEIEKLINLLSIPKNKLLTSGVVISNDAINQVYDDAAITVSGVMGGYNLSEWSEEDQAYIQSVSGDYQFISLSGWTDYIDTQISTCLLTFINLDGIVDDLKAKYDANPNSPITATPDDDPEIEDLKLTYQVNKSFHVKKAADNITLGLTKLSDYLPNQQIVIQQEIDNRDSQEKFGNEPNNFRRFRYENERRVREYIGLVESLNVYNIDYITSNDVFYISGTPVNFFAEEGGTPLSGDLIQNATYVLRNICLKTSYQRDFLKNIARKHAIIGTSRIVQTIVSEYIARNFSSDRYWGYHTFEEVSSPQTDISNLPVIDEELSSNILGDIRVVEYFDNTEYMNISANNEWSFTEPLVNERFWEGDNADVLKLLSEHTSAEVSSFYSNLGLNLTEAQIEEFLNHIYDIGAVTATLYPTFETVPYTLPITGTFGEYGRYEVDGTTLYLSADILPVYENQQSTEYSDWLGSPLISSKFSTSAEFLTEWLETPSASAWQFGITIDTVEGTTDLIIDNSQFNFDNEDAVSAWVVDTYAVSSWTENEVTNIWRESPLISRLPIEDFQQAWSEEPVISSWTSYSAVTAPTPPFDRLDWDSIPEYIDYLAVSGPITSQSQWLTTEFVRSWNDEPFDIDDVSVSFDQETDWALSSNPFVSGWLSGDPFVNTFTNADSITAVSAFANQDLMATYLNSIGAIDDPSGGFDNPTLSAMHFKYIGSPSGDFIPANDKNVVHPSIALQPYIWNLVEAVLENIFFEDIYIPVVLEPDDLSGRIDETGAPINMWRKNAQDFTGYRTYYEYSKNLDTSFIEDERIDPDGPWHAPALKSYLDPVSGQVDNMLSAWYDHLDLTIAETQKISSQLDFYRSNIESLSSKIIYNYAVDQFGNHYTLFKDDDEFETAGELWIRYNDHPLSFPIVDVDASESQVQFPDLNARKSQLISVTQNCFDFGIDYVATQTAIWAYGSNDPVPGPNTYEITVPFIERADVTGYEIKLERWPSLFSHKVISREQYKFVGAYANENNFIIVQVTKPPGALDATGPALELVGDTYTATIQWDVINYYTGQSNVKTKVRNLKYSEYEGSNNQSQWRLAKGEDTVTVAFESEGLILEEDIIGSKDRFKLNTTITSDYLGPMNNWSIGEFADIDNNRAVIYDDSLDLIYVYEYNALNEEWTREHIIDSPSLGGGDDNDNRLSIRNNRIIAGAPFSDIFNTHAGAAYVYEYNGSTWNETAILSGDGIASDLFGFAVAIKEDTIMVGAVENNTVATDSGIVYVYDYDNITSAWLQTQTLTGSLQAVADNFGFSISLNNNRVIVGSPYHNTAGNTDNGIAYVFDYNTTLSTWTETQFLTGTGNLFSATFDEDYFGWSVSLDGDRVVVGAPGEDAWWDGNTFSIGVAYVFDYDTTLSAWSETQILTAEPNDPSTLFDADFGHSVSIKGDLIVASSPRETNTPPVNSEGAVRVFGYDDDVSGWVFCQKLISPTLDQSNPPSWFGQFLFGRCVALNNNGYMIAGTLRDNAYIYKNKPIFEYSTDTAFHIKEIGQTNSYFDPSENECDKLYDNTITVMDFDIGTNTSIGDNARDPEVSYYYSYTDVTYQGINANNGIIPLPLSATLSATKYNLTSGECIKLQYFGNPQTSATFLVNDDNAITCFNDVNGNFGVVLGFGLVTWETALSSWDEYGAISATWELSSDFTHIFTSAGEIYPSGGDYTTTSGYYIKYNGEGCHLFEVCYDPS